MNGRTRWKLIIITFFSVNSVLYSQQDSALASHPLSFQAIYTGDFVNNVSGGIQSGSCYLGMANIIIGFDTKAGGLWSGGSIYFKGASTHGATPSASLIGDFQIASNIEAGDHTYIQEAWYRQTFGPVSVTVGLQDLNSTFAANEFSGAFLNSSFGIHPTISTTIPVSIFPLTSPGVTAVWNMSDRISLLACVYDANPVEFPDNPYNIRWRFTVGDGVIAAAEAQISTGDENHFQDVYKIGVYNNDHFSVIDMETNIPNSVYENNYGVYFTVDQSIAGEPSTAGAVTVFVRGSVTTKQYNENYRFAGAGINYYGLFNADGSDMVGLAIARAALASTDDETAFELTYQRPVTENITFQPDIQYIVHPAGTSTVLPDAIVGTIRFGIRF